MTKTSKQNVTRSKHRLNASDKTALSEAQLEAAKGGDGASPSLFNGSATGSHYSK